MQPQLVSNYKRILDLNYVKVTGNNSSFKSINAKFIYNYLVNQTSGVYLSNDLNTEKYNFVINKGLKGEDILVKSRLLCKMLYNVFTISTYQN